MPTDQAPIDVNDPKLPAESDTTAGSSVGGAPDSGGSALETQAAREAGSGAEPGSPVVRGSRWVDYDTHELLQMIGELEDERRWARLREGVWLAILIHLILISAVTWLPKYVFKVPPVIDRTDALKQHKDFTYLDTPYQFPSKPIVKPVPLEHPLIDKQTLESMKRVAPPEPAPQAAAPPTPVPPPIPLTQQPQIESPRPAAVPARPNFAMGSQNPSDQLRDAMKGASRNPGMGASSLPPGGGLPMHPGAGAGGLQVLSDTQGVDFSNWIQRWHRETQNTWDPLIPESVNSPINRSGQVLIRFKVLPNGRILEPMYLEGRSGDVALDRAAWGALTGSNYPPLPKDFHGPYLELRAWFLYNMEPPR